MALRVVCTVGMRPERRQAPSHAGQSRSAGHGSDCLSFAQPAAFGRPPVLQPAAHSTGAITPLVSMNRSLLQMAARATQAAANANNSSKGWLFYQPQAIRLAAFHALGVAAEVAAAAAMYAGEEAGILVGKISVALAKNPEGHEAAVSDVMRLAALLQEAEETEAIRALKAAVEAAKSGMMGVGIAKVVGNPEMLSETPKAIEAIKERFTPREGGGAAPASTAAQ